MYGVHNNNNKSKRGCFVYSAPSGIVRFNDAMLKTVTLNINDNYPMKFQFFIHSYSIHLYILILCCSFKLQTFRTFSCVK